MYSIIQGNEDKNKQNDMTLTVQNVTPIKYQVFKSKTDPEEERKKIPQTYKSKPHHKTSPDQPCSDLNYIE